MKNINISPGSEVGQVRPGSPKLLLLWDSVSVAHIDYVGGYEVGVESSKFSFFTQLLTSPAICDPH